MKKNTKIKGRKGARGEDEEGEREGEERDAGKKSARKKNKVEGIAVKVEEKEETDGNSVESGRRKEIKIQRK